LQPGPTIEWRAYLMRIPGADFTNFAPDMEYWSITPEYFDRVVQAMVELALRRGDEGRTDVSRMPSAALLSSEADDSATTTRRRSKPRKAKAKPAAKKKVPAKKKAQAKKKPAAKKTSKKKTPKKKSNARPARRAS